MHNTLQMKTINYRFINKGVDGLIAKLTFALRPEHPLPYKVTHDTMIIIRRTKQTFASLA